MFHHNHGGKEGIGIGLSGWAIMIIVPILLLFDLFKYVITYAGIACWLWVIYSGVRRLFR